jgi:hypothetical protein
MAVEICTEATQWVQPGRTLVTRLSELMSA